MQILKPKFGRQQYLKKVISIIINWRLMLIVSPIFSLTLLSMIAPLMAQSTPLPSPRVKPTMAGVISFGGQISFNGRTVPGQWIQQRGKTVVTQISDAALRQLVGVDLLNTSILGQQPVQWFTSVAKPQILTSSLQGGYRYLDITKFAQTAQWQMQANGDTLIISTPETQITDIREGKTDFKQVIVYLDRATPWQAEPGSLIKKPLPPTSIIIIPDSSTPKPPPPNREWTITLDGIAASSLVQRYTPRTNSPINIFNLGAIKLPPVPTIPTQSTDDPLIRGVEVANNKTQIRLNVPFGYAPRVTTADNPNRLTIDIRPDALVSRTINWARGLSWQQKFINLGSDRFPVTWLEIQPQAGIKLRPIYTNSETLEGTAPLIRTAPQQLAAGAINGGFFNRKNQLPLGAIRRDGKWLSGPILNRGAIAWNDSGQFYVGRLDLNETLITSNGQQLSISHLNSGYVQQGIARYTPLWGLNYTPLTDNEMILVVQNDGVTTQLSGGIAGDAVPIPRNGYLLTFRAQSAQKATELPVGTKVRIVSSSNPTQFNNYPHILGAGPLLIQNGKIVLDAKSEGFSDAFAAQEAIRSAICTTSTGKVIVAAVHDRAGDRGPSLAEHAQIMQQMGCVNALNLDGGSSTSLYLGGQLLDRSPSTAARVHNGIGIFLPSSAK